MSTIITALVQMLQNKKEETRRKIEEEFVINLTVISRHLNDVLPTANAMARRLRRQQVERQNAYFGLQVVSWLNKVAYLPLVFTRADVEPASVYVHTLVLRRYFGVHHNNMDFTHKK